MGFLASFRALVGYIGYLLHKARRRSHLIVQADQAALGAMKCSIMQFSKPYINIRGQTCRFFEQYFIRSSLYLLRHHPGHLNVAMPAAGIL